MGTDSKKILQNTLMLTLTEIIARIMSLLLIMAVARKLGPELMGIYAFGVTFVGIFQIFVNFGLEPFIQREVSRRPDIAGRLMAQIFVLKLIIYLAAVILILIFSLAAVDSEVKRWVVWILTGTMFFQTNFTATNAFFRAYQKAKYEAMVRMSLRVVYTSLGLAAILSGRGLLTLVTLEFIAQAGACLLAWSLFIKRIGNPFHALGLSHLKKLILSARDFFLIRIVQTIFNSIDLLMLSLMAGDTATGFYSVAVRLTGAFDFLPTAFTGAFLPVISRQARTDQSAFVNTFRPYYKYLFIIGLGVAVALSGLAEGWIVFLFGTSFKLAAPTLVALSIALMLTFANWSISNAIIALDKEKLMLKIFGLCAGFNILLNLLLIPKFQHNGAAWATVASQTLLLVLQLAALGRNLLASLTLGRLSIKPLLAGVITCGLAWWLVRGHFNLLLGLVLIGMGFLALLFITRSITYTELTEARHLLHRRN
jgi:O-antigen/teichoic acid export membrane protein